MLVEFPLRIIFKRLARFRKSRNEDVGRSESIPEKYVGNIFFRGSWAVGISSEFWGGSMERQQEAIPAGDGAAIKLRDQRELWLKSVIIQVNQGREMNYIKRTNLGSKQRRNGALEGMQRIFQILGLGFPIATEVARLHGGAQVSGVFRANSRGKGRTGVAVLGRMDYFPGAFRVHSSLGKMPPTRKIINESRVVFKVRVENANKFGEAENQVECEIQGLGAYRSCGKRDRMIFRGAEHFPRIEAGLIDQYNHTFLRSLTLGLNGEPRKPYLTRVQPAIQSETIGLHTPVSERQELERGQANVMSPAALKCKGLICWKDMWSAGGVPLYLVPHHLTYSEMGRPRSPTAKTIVAPRNRRNNNNQVRQKMYGLREKLYMRNEKNTWTWAPGRVVTATTQKPAVRSRDTHQGLEPARIIGEAVVVGVVFASNNTHDTLEDPDFRGSLTDVRRGSNIVLLPKSKRRQLRWNFKQGDPHLIMPDYTTAIVSRLASQDTAVESDRETKQHCVMEELGIGMAVKWQPGKNKLARRERKRPRSLDRNMVHRNRLLVPAGSLLRLRLLVVRGGLGCGRERRGHGDEDGDGREWGWAWGRGGAGEGRRHLLQNRNRNSAARIQIGGRALRVRAPAEAGGERTGEGEHAREGDEGEWGGDAHDGASGSAVVIDFCTAGWAGSDTWLFAHGGLRWWSTQELASVQIGMFRYLAPSDPGPNKARGAGKERGGSAFEG
ncbi:hypothetical protein B0H17DRAFT_1176668 [Mycena rosella]|uniref:Uncharacterized protein n=1 Tax=Mycena rosella TaxID=1033263 RepID=A0AAD7DVJ9_MYCRO|nr:hypothetical protein B0H17DRAFT_1176668 [Mycena rosella]